MESCGCCVKWSSFLVMSSFSSVRIPSWMPFQSVFRSTGARVAHAFAINLRVELILDGQVQNLAMHTLVHVVFHSVFTVASRRAQNQGDGTLPDVVPPVDQNIFNRVGRGLRLLADDFDAGAANRRSLFGYLSAIFSQGWRLFLQLF